MPLAVRCYEEHLMPWHVGKHAGCPPSKPYAVLKNDTDELVACHATREGAEAQMRALYANEPAAKAVLTSKQRERLPDSAYACPEKRLYPHHHADGSLDLVHLRAALSRIGDTSNDQCGKAHLEAHAKAQNMGDRAGKASMAVKATVLDDDHFRVLAIPYDGPIKADIAPRGVDKDLQWFSANTDIKPQWFAERPVMWHHGSDPYGVMGRRVLGKATDLVEDDMGWWVDVWLKHGEERVNLIKRIAERGTVFGSSGSVPSMAKIKTTKGDIVPWRRNIPGEIVAWPYIEQTLSTSPVNTLSVLQPAKASLEDFDAAGIAVPDPVRSLLSDLDALGSSLLAPSFVGEEAAKAGRVLSARNEKALREALAKLDDVLAQLAKDEAEEPEDVRVIVPSVT